MAAVSKIALPYECVGKPIKPVLCGTNIVRCLYLFRALFALGEAELDNWKRNGITTLWWRRWRKYISHILSFYRVILKIVKMSKTLARLSGSILRYRLLYFDGLLWYSVLVYQLYWTQNFTYTVKPRLFGLVGTGLDSPDNRESG